MLLSVLVCTAFGDAGTQRTVYLYNVTFME